ncbi:hypothetical protein [Rossellomorea vietnamensis]|nr:hypothetical protein [Rossellomorea vietnamensis]
MWWMQNFFKYSWRVNILFIPAWFFLYLAAFRFGFTNWTDATLNINDLYAAGCVIGSIVFFMLTRRQAIKEFNDQYPPGQESEQ